jgi:hypothetical protein
MSQANTAFVEREDGMHGPAPQLAEDLYRCAKDWRFHEAITPLTLYACSF